MEQEEPDDDLSDALFEHDPANWVWPEHRLGDTLMGFVLGVCAAAGAVAARAAGWLW